jgi:kynureninase
MAHQRPFGFETGAMALREEPSWRFLGGTPHVPALYAARAGYRVVREVGIRAIRERSLDLTGGLIEQARERGWRVVTPLPAARRGGSVTLDLPDPHALVKRLGEEDILFDARPRAGVRIGPHFVTTEDEIPRCVEALALAMEG